MTKKEFIEKIINHSGFDKQTVSAVLDSTSFIIKEALILEEKVPFINLGSFNTQIREKREIITPDGNPITTPARRVVKFKVSKNLKELISFD